MRKTIRLKAIVSFIVICVILAVANISRAYSVNGGLSSSSKLVVGSEVVVVFSLSDIDMADGVRSITVENVDYDKAVFEEISGTSFSGSAGWSAGYNAANGKATFTNSTPMTSNGAVITLTLKVKSGITSKSTTITFKNIVAASSVQTTGNITVGTKTVTIKADEEATSGSEEKQPEAPAAVQEEKKANNTPVAIKSSKSNTKHLKAGDSATMMIISSIVVVLAIAIIGFVKYAKNRDIK